MAWALAAVFHLTFSFNANNAFLNPTPLGILFVAVAVCALWMLWQPGDLRPLLALAVLSPITVVLETPIVGNHWVLEALTDVALLVTAALSLRSRRIDVARLMSRFLPVARMLLLIFYAFAAFSKINSGFIDPAVSCSVVFSNEIARSYGIPFAPIQSWLGPVIPWAIIVIEGSIPALLFIRRTRHLGVVVGLVFHAFIGLDLQHWFSDFSSGLNALFILFIPEQFFTQTVSGFMSLKVKMRRLTRELTAVVFIVLLVALFLAGEQPFRAGWQVLTPALWFICDAATIFIVVRFLWRSHPEPQPLFAGLRNAPILWLIPVLALLNGLSPYLELKTGYAWNMYSNLVTADGSTNHLIVPATLHLSHEQDHMIQILSSSDGQLQLYADYRWDISPFMLRSYIQSHPDASLRYRQDGVVHDVPRAGSDPVLGVPVAEWQVHLLPFRSLDDANPPRCQTTFFPAD